MRESSFKSIHLLIGGVNRSVETRVMEMIVLVGRLDLTRWRSPVVGGAVARRRYWGLVVKGAVGCLLGMVWCTG